MAITALNIRNTSTAPLSLDIMFDPRRQIRTKLALNATLDVSSVCSADELNRHPTIQSLLSAGKIAITDGSAGSSDIGPVVSQAELDVERVQSAKVTQVGGSPFAVTIAGLGLQAMANADYRVIIGGETVGNPMVDESTITSSGFSILNGANGEVLHVLIQGQLA